ncbi:MAG: F0F1 ATP synthase subunit B [Nocardia sp.]|nr:F0F1 ATP synthase subunit B [Nocardia sp.]
MSARTDVVAGDNFLIPNGTFFVELIIFLIVLGVIWFLVVPPVRKVLTEREERVEATAANAKEAKQTFAEAEEKYQSVLEQARTEAADIRNEARAEGRTIIDDHRAQAQREVDGILAESATQLRAEADRVKAELHTEVEPLAQTLADRVVGDSRHAGAAGGGRGRES